MRFDTITYKNGRLMVIDQRLLPGKLKKIVPRNARDICSYIRTLAVRGAPAIGVFAAYGLFLAARSIKTRDKKVFLAALNTTAGIIRKSRPTAVNLSWALDKMLYAARNAADKGIPEIIEALREQALAIHEQDRIMCQAIGNNGASLIQKNDTILTHCNAGFLATGGMGTALAVIYTANEQGKRVKVYATETRPLLQGARLTAWELHNKGVDVTLICDNMAAVVMKQKGVDKIIVGADRIARNGDTANKIGTYALSVLARAHNIPFFVAAPSSTIDFSIKDGSHIPIEQRSGEEITNISRRRVAPYGIKTFNPAFDVTPSSHISAIITEAGIMKKPYQKTLRA
ncbi:MAG: S-methyl-5-thioribose-1-phosphate isomerase [Candidatus Omnitrophica bacterium]|nr:S-methyl-5-thioribose-1-phosphate isomerase [Candidatus Omnitrophota bacterium]